MSSPKPDPFPAEDSTDAEMQEASENFSHITLAIETMKKEAEADRCAYIKKRMEENRLKFAEITKNNHMMSEERRNLGVINSGKTDNLLTKRMKEAIDMQNGDGMSSSQENEHASVTLFGSATKVKISNPVRPISLPKVEKIPNYTTWVFSDRNEIMRDDESVIGQRQIYYERDGCETQVHCSDGEEQTTYDEDEKNQEFVKAEDNIIWSTIERQGSSETVYNLIAQSLSRKPCEIKERYEALKCSTSRDTDSEMNSFLDEDLEAAQDLFNTLFCRRCLIFGCQVHGCSQELIYPAAEKKSSTIWNNMDEENVPCGPHCYVKLEGNSEISPVELRTEQATTILSADSEFPVIKETSDGPSLCKRLKPSSYSQKESESSDSETMPVHDVDPINPSPSTNEHKRARECETNGTKKTKESVISTELIAEDTKKRSLSDFESWKTLEKSLLKKGVEIFGRNSCSIARNVIGPLKTCAEVYHALQYDENNLNSQGINIMNSQDDDDNTETNDNMGAALPRRAKLKLSGSHAMRKQISHKELHSRQYNPCGCQSVCGDDCSCLDNTTCGKYCGCPKTCKNRFRGCYCIKSQCRSRQCPCFDANIECDPDVCRQCWISCGDETLGSPSTKGNNSECQNMKLLLKQEQSVLVGKSDVSGWGLFLKNDVAKDEYVGEYTGELISHLEADKRGRIYDIANSSFLFNLNDKFVLDAKRQGNKLKFINHSLNPNCYAKVMMVSGDHRLGIFATRNITAGEELFCDYGYEPDTAPSWAKEPED